MKLKLHAWKMYMKNKLFCRIHKMLCFERIFQLSTQRFRLTKYVLMCTHSNMCGNNTHCPMFTSYWNENICSQMHQLDYVHTKTKFSHFIVSKVFRASIEICVQCNFQTSERERIHWIIFSTNPSDFMNELCKIQIRCGFMYQYFTIV